MKCFVDTISCSMQVSTESKTSSLLESARQLFASSYDRDRMSEDISCSHPSLSRSLNSKKDGVARLSIIGHPRMWLLGVQGLKKICVLLCSAQLQRKFLHDHFRTRKVKAWCYFKSIPVIVLGYAASTRVVRKEENQGRICHRNHLSKSGQHTQRLAW